MACKINRHVKNSRVSIKGRDIVLDYEFKLHLYDHKFDLIEKGLVPVEMYPYEEDILVGYIPVDSEFGVIDLQELYEWAITAIRTERKEDAE